MKKYSKEIKIHPCRLEEDDLFGLEKILIESVDKKRIDDYKIYANTENVDISENNIIDFMRHDLPSVISRLSFSVTGWSKDNEIHQNIDLTFYDSFIILRVRGNSESWVKGKSTQIIDFLKSKRPFLWFLKTTPMLMFRGAIFLFMIVGTVLFVIQIITKGFDSAGILLPFLLISSWMVDYSLSKFQYTQIYIKKKKSFIEKYNTTIFILGATASVVTILGFIINLLKGK